VKLLFAKSRWEIENLPYAEYIARTARDGFEVLEINALTLSDRELPEFAREARAAGLRSLVQGLTFAPTPEGQMEELECQVERAMLLEPLSFNFHLGKDHFPVDVNRRLHEHALETAARFGVPLHAETHRGRACHSLPTTVELLRLVPGLTLTGDFSHFTCVHESNLADQPANVAECIEAVRHIHARVGFDEGPQVADPLSPHFAPWLELFTGFWTRMLESREKAGDSVVTMTTEAGPPGYMWIDPASGDPIRDPWAVNVALRDHLAGVFSRYR
jgi:sugar phosphate isomerase/epimerase